MLGMVLAAVLAASPVQDTTVAERIDGFITPYVEGGVWSGSILVARGDTVLHTRGYGWADAEHGVPNRPDTRFPVASVTKAFTRVAAGRLWRAGVMRPDDPLSTYLPDFPRGGEITIRHLVRHRSGIPDTDQLPWFSVGQRFAHDIEELVDSLAAVPLEFDPGTEYSYSNGGYTVLARAMEVATGVSYGEILERRVFGPANMKRSGDWNGGLVRDRAEGYSIGPDGELVPGPYVHPSNKIGAGSAYTTVEDILAFHRALRDEVLLPAASRDSLFGTIDSAFGEPRLYFGGRGPSYTASVQMYPGEDLLVVALGNNYARLNEEITDGIVALVLGHWEEARIEGIVNRALPFREASVPEDELRELAGTYAHPWGFRFELALEDDGLVYVDAEHRTRSAIVPTGPTTYVSPFQWAEIRVESEGLVWRWLDFPDRGWELVRLGP